MKSPHRRLATTPTNLLDGEYPPNMLVVDCSCGDEYLVKEGGDEFARLEAARAAHVEAAARSRKAAIDALVTRRGVR